MIRPIGARPAEPERQFRPADVLITPSDGRPLEVQVDELFTDFGGLTLVVITGEGREVGIGTRDGVIATLLLDPVRLAAVVVHQG